MSSLDALLAEVRPILGSSQFTHPSFKEVLTARQFADEINSGRLSVKSAAYSLWLYDSYGDVLAAQDNSGYCDDLPYGCYFEPKGLRSEWRPALAHLAGMLNEDKAREFVDVVGDFHKDNISSIMREPSIHGRSVVLEDFALCARFIGRYQTSVSPEGNEKQILDALICVALVYEGLGPTRDAHVVEQGRLARSALALTRSEYVAERLVDFIGKADVDADMETQRQDLMKYDKISKMREYANDVIRGLVKRGVDIDQFLRGRSSKELRHASGVIGILKEEFGGLGCLEELINDLPAVFVSPSSPKRDRYIVAYRLGGIFKSMQRLGFPSRFIQLFNDIVSKIREESVIELYRDTLVRFATGFETQYGTSLYNHLEKNKMQFWDYWMVYKPK